MRILLVEDHLAIAKLVKQQLSNQYVIDYCNRAKKALFLLEQYDYSLIILDVGLPDFNGFALCKKIRKFNINVPILFLTGRSSIEDKVTGLNLGADDYLLKPFNIKELEARIKNLLRRTKDTSSVILQYKELIYDVLKKEVKFKNNKLDLNRKELLILELLLRNKGKIISRDVILNHVWNKDKSFNNIIAVQVSNLRKKIDKRFKVKIIKTIHGLGYKIG